jgi:hypothetical protein
MKFLQTMPCRVSSYESASEGYNITQQYLIAFNDVCNGGQNILIPAGYTDYIGSFLYIPFISRLFDIAISSSTILFFFSYGLICIILSLIGLYKLYNTTYAKIYGTICILFLGIFFIAVSDTYSFYGLTSLCLLTWWSKMVNKNIFFSKKNIIFFIFTGIIIGFSNSVRGNSGNDILLSIIIIYFINFFLKKNFKSIGIVVLVVLPIIFFSLFLENIKNSSKKYLINNTDILNYKIDLNYVRAHWHNAYYSLGFLNGKNNKDVPEPSDTYSVKKAHSINPDIVPYSKEYERLLKNEYFNFVKKYPYFFIKSKFAKIGVILFYIIVFFNIGLYFLYKKKCSNVNLLFFIPGIILNSLFGIATEPNYTYLLGLFAYCSIFSTNLIDDFFTKTKKLQIH